MPVMPLRAVARVAVSLLLFAVSALAQPQAAPLTADILFTHARVLDGSGKAAIDADVAIRGDRIVFVGNAQRSRVLAQQTYDLHGLYLAPGFIDLHTHTAGNLSDPKRHENLNYLLQGVTTVVTGNDGNSPWPIQATLERWEHDGIGTNAAVFVGFGTVRRQAIRVADAGQPASSEDRAPTPAELTREEELVRQGMREGAIGISTGLFYVPQSFSKTDEVVAVSRAAAELGGLYDSHLRDEDSYNIGVRSAVAEAIEIGRQDHMPIMISHIKCLGPEAWGCSKDVIAAVERARAEGIKVVANQYPYDASGTALEAAVMPNWAMEGGRQRFLARLADSAQRRRMLDDIPRLIAKRGGAGTLVIVGFAPGRAERDLAEDMPAGSPSGPDVTRDMVFGKSLQQIADAWKIPPNEAVLRILQSGSTSVVSHNMNERDIAAFMRQDWVATGSDGSAGHPRFYGTFARKLEKYVVADKVISLPFAVRAATSLPAQIAGFAERGAIRPGYYADIVVFDLAKVHAAATFTSPEEFSQGFVHVLVNGQFAVKSGEPTHALAGRVLRGPAFGKQLSATSQPSPGP